LKPHVICHMSASIDGRTLPGRWQPAAYPTADVYERLHAELKGDAWLIGRVTGEDFAQGRGYPQRMEQCYPRATWIAGRASGPYGVVLDAHGKLSWGRAEVNGDPLVVVLTEQVADAHLAGLRGDGVSYLFAGQEHIDLALALEALNRELKIERLLLEGGGTLNGAFLRAGLIDEISLVIEPAVDGAQGAPSVFHSSANESQGAVELDALELTGCQTIDGGAVWLRYRLRKSPH
jgi:riboflavin biosynthesis pyrimidine reductase